MINISVRVEDSESFSSSSSGDPAVNNTGLHASPHEQSNNDLQNHDTERTNRLLRDVLLNKSLSFDGVRCSSIRDKRMIASSNEIPFSCIHGNLYDSSSTSSSNSDDGGHRDLHFACALSTTTDDCNSLTSSKISHKSHREKMLIRRRKLKNIKFLDSPLDLLSSSSSEGEDESNHNLDPAAAAIIKREASKIADNMLLHAICDFSSDESSSCSVSDLCKCEPPSVIDHVNLSSASSAASPKNGTNTAPGRRRFRTSTPTGIRRRMMANMMLSGSPQELSLLLDLTKPPSLMEQISGKSDRGGRSSASSNSLNSLSSEIFDLPGSDPKVNEAANELVEGINELTKNADFEDNKTFPIHEPAVTGSQENVSVTGNAGSCPSTGDFNTTTYSIEPSPVVSPFEIDLNANDQEELLGDVSPVPIMDYMRIAMTRSVDERSLDEVDAKSDFGVDDLPTDNTTTLIAGDSTQDENKTLMSSADDSSGAGNSSKATSYKTCLPPSEEVSSSNSYYTDAWDDALNDSSNSEFKSAEDYERFLINENAKLIAHTFAEMANCTNSSATTDDFRSLVSTSSFDVLDINDLSLTVSDEEESRATYNVSSDTKKKAGREFDLTYKLESPRITTSRSTGFMSSHSRSNASSDTTYSLDPPPKEKSVVKIRETRSSALRTERARKVRSMEVRSSDFKSFSHSPSADSSRSAVRGTTTRQTFAKAVTRPAPFSAIATAASCSQQSMTVQQSDSASKYLPSYRKHTTASKARTGVQAKFSAFLQRIRS